MPTADPVPVRLPGVGTQLDLRDEDGRRITAVRRVDGHSELYRGDRSVLRMDEPATQALGAFLSGHYVLPAELVERMSGVIGGLTFDWVHLPPGAHAAGRTIGQLKVRQRTGVTIVAVLRGSLPIVAVDADTVLQPGDELVFTSRPQDEDGFRRYVLGGS